MEKRQRIEVLGFDEFLFADILLPGKTNTWALVNSRLFVHVPKPTVRSPCVTERIGFLSWDQFFQGHTYSFLLAF